MESKLEHQTELRIYEAAKKIFHKHGYSGARMQEIADEAGINKAMLHYYFRSKDKLFDAIFIDALDKIFFRIGHILKSNEPFEQKIKQFTESYINILLENTFLPAFILHELNHNSEKLKFIMKEKLEEKPIQLLNQIKSELIKHGIEDIDPRHFIVNLLSLCLFPFAAKPLMMINLGFSEEEYSKFIEERKKLIPEFILKPMKKL